MHGHWFISLREQDHAVLGSALHFIHITWFSYVFGNIRRLTKWVQFAGCSSDRGATFRFKIRFSCLKHTKNMTLNGRIDGITDFGIALAYKHCHLTFCSIVLQIDWSKTVSDRNAI